MSEHTFSTPYSRQALQALRRTLDIHQAIVWVDPATNQLAVKRIELAADDRDQGDQTQPLRA